MALGAFGVLCALCPAASLAAQTGTLAIAIGATQLRLADAGTFSSVSLSPIVGYRSPLASLSLQGTLSQLGAEGWSSQGLLQAALFTPVSRGGWATEFGASLGGAAFPGGTTTAQRLAALRLHRVATIGSAWAGGSLGSLYDGARWRRLRQLELGFVADVGSWRLSGALQPSVVDDTLRYSDVTVALQTSVSAVDAAFSFGARSGAALPIPGGDRRLWGGVSLDLWISPRVALQAGAGAYPVDATQGFPAGEYVSLGFRAGARRRATASVRAESRETQRAARVAGLRAMQIAADAEGLVIRVHAPEASSVELQGDLTLWRVLALRPSGGGWWMARLPRPAAATAELALRVDAGPWLVPPGSQTVRDEFGGVSGRVTLPPL